MTRGCAKHQRVLAAAAALVIGGAARGYAQFTSFSGRASAVLEGNWQSCRESDGRYSERIYDARIPGLGDLEFHMGPYHEFALFRGIQDEHRSHGSADNLLRPYTVEVVDGAGQQRWVVAGLSIDVVLAGGSREECESWFVTLKRIDTSH